MSKKKPPFLNKLFIEDYEVNLYSINKAVVSKHFVDGPINAELALEATKQRFLHTSSGKKVKFNTVFERPSHLMRVAYWEEDGGRCERIISPEPLETFQCFYDDIAGTWRAGYVGSVWFVLTMQDHLDIEHVRKQFQHNFELNSVSIAELKNVPAKLNPLIDQSVSVK